MTRFYTRLMVGFTALFIVAVIGAFAYQFIYVIPAQKCEAAGDWWEPHSRSCAAPIFLPHITGRPISHAEAAAAAAAGLPEAERKSPKPEVDPRPAF